MKTYFKLQYLRLNRGFRDFGVHPLVGYLALLIVFISFSLLLFAKTKYANYLYLLLALSFIQKLSDSQRNDFLQICYKKRKYRKLRIIENCLNSLPFLILLLYEQEFIYAFILFFLSILLVFLKFKIAFRLTIPTPFYKKPFEFIIGFRYTFLFFFLFYFSASMAIIHNNLNLGMVSLMLIFLTISAFYLQQENEYYVWSYNLSAKSFLKEKIKTALIYSSYLSLPVILSLIIFNDLHYSIYIVIVSLVGLSFITVVILIKYSIYPEELPALTYLLMVVALIIPPTMIFIIYQAYNQSIKQLKRILQ